jgi:hypothetical protein
MLEQEFWAWSVRDTRKALWVFWASGPEGSYPELRPEYAPFACEECGRYDALDLLENVGLPADVRIMERRDALVSFDHQLIVSAGSRDVIASIPHADVRFFPLPADPDYFLMYPTHIIEPPGRMKACVGHFPPEEGEAFCSLTKRCKTCRRRSVRFSEKNFHVPDDLVVGAVRLVVQGPVCYSWIGNQEASATLRTAKLKGWWLRSNAFAN